MDIINISDEITERIHKISELRQHLKKAGELKASKIAMYEKDIAICILRLKAGDIKEFEGLEVNGKLPANLIEKIARGMCWKQKQEAETAEMQYKGIVVSLQAVQAELNGLQTLFRHLAEN